MLIPIDYKNYNVPNGKKHIHTYISSLSKGTLSPYAECLTTNLGRMRKVGEAKPPQRPPFGPSSFQRIVAVH